MSLCGVIPGAPENVDMIDDISGAEASLAVMSVYISDTLLRRSLGLIVPSLNFVVMLEIILDNFPDDMSPIAIIIGSPPVFGSTLLVTVSTISCRKSVLALSDEHSTDSFSKVSADSEGLIRAFIVRRWFHTASDVSDDDDSRILTMSIITLSEYVMTFVLNNFVSLAAIAFIFVSINSLNTSICF